MSNALLLAGAIACGFGIWLSYSQRGDLDPGSLVNIPAPEAIAFVGGVAAILAGVAKR